MQKRTRAIAYGIASSLQYYEDLGRKIYEYDFPVRHSFRSLRAELADRHNLSCSPHVFKTALKTVLQEHPDWIQYKHSLFYKPSAEYIANLSDEDLADSRSETWTCGGGSYVTLAARQLAQDALGMTEPGYTLADLKTLHKAGLVYYRREQALRKLSPDTERGR